ncbi:MAG: DNA mismatch repair endonuclease MutL [Lachnospiraceae bacterium]
MGIAVLDESTINKIAAGEVIERPSSVVKELVENAIDAKATAITVEIKEGGISFIRITDNGCGINADELALAFTSHATSKIKSVEDLMTVASLGFRGEALASIAAVAQVELITKPKESFSGRRYVIEGGKEISNEEIGAPDGTTFIVRNLFYNTPVRKKFLKTATTEAGYISALVEHMALSNPNISFRFINNNQNKLHTSGNGNLKEIIYQIYGRDITGNLIEIDAKTQDFSIKGFIGKPLISRGNRSYENYYVNRRYIRSNVLARAIEEAYQGFIMLHQYPFVVLNFEIAPEIIDVNVHPTKMELRFSNSEYVYSFTMRTLRDALSGRELIPKVSLDDLKFNDVVDTTPKQDVKPVTPVQVPKERIPEPFEVKRTISYQQEAKKTVPIEKVMETAGIEKYSAGDSRQYRQEVLDDKLLDVKTSSKIKLIGQLFETYWLIEFEDKFFIMDQHAAHEKVLYEKLMKNLEENKMISQQLNPPMIISLRGNEENILKDNMDIFLQMGFELESFGGNEYKVTAIPSSLPRIDEKQLLIEMIDSLAENNGKRSRELVAQKVASMACKAAIKGHDTITAIEAKALIDELMELENPYNCPHGRPTLISMTRYEIEKKFKRIV